MIYLHGGDSTSRHGQHSFSQSRCDFLSHRPLLDYLGAESESRTLLALQKAKISAATYETVTVSWTTGPNAMNYPYRVSCFARDPVSPIAMTRCLDIPNNQANLVASVDGLLPLEYSKIEVTLGTEDDAIRAAVGVDCFVEVSGASTSKCKYAGGVNFANYPPCPLTCGDVAVGDTFVVNGETFTRQDRAYLDALIAPTNGDYEAICTTGITDFSNVFQGSVLNPEISSWDVSSATTLDSMFESATGFNQLLTCWNVSPSASCTNFGLDASTWVATYGSNAVTGTNPPLSDELIAAGCTISSSP